jgi:hypothetical protein
LPQDAEPAERTPITNWLGHVPLRNNADPELPLSVVPFCHHISMCVLATAPCHVSNPITVPWLIFFRSPPGWWMPVTPSPTAAWFTLQPAWRTPPGGELFSRMKLKSRLKSLASNVAPPMVCVTLVGFAPPQPAR